MPALKQKPKADTLYVCFESFASDSRDGNCARGTRLRGDHPIVRNYPQFFVPDGTPDDELERIRRDFYEASGSPPPPRQ
jgi:hypothetical protein